jgi:hypothetical protein
LQYTSGKEEEYFKDIAELDKISLAELLRSHQVAAHNACKALAATFTAAATGLLDNIDGNDSGTTYTSEADSTGSAEEDSAYDTDDDETEDDGFDDDDMSDTSSGNDDYHYASEIYYENDTPTEDGDDSSFVDDDHSETSSSVYDDVWRMEMSFHTLMREVLEHNAASCLIQFALSMQGGKGNDGPSLVRAMVPWTFDKKDNDMEANLIELAQGDP